MSSSSTPSRKRPRRSVTVTALAKSTQPDYTSESLACLERGQRCIVFSGAGISVSGGLLTFSDLYAKAAKKYGGKNGMRAFHFRFLQKSAKDCFQFLMQQFRCVQKASPTKSHHALQTMAKSGQLIRHYTMNIDGLANHLDYNLCEKTVELHGSLEELVCRSCGSIYKSIDILGEKQVSEKKMSLASGVLPPNCMKCKEGELRFRVLLYEDQEGKIICSDNPLETILIKDMKECEFIIWVGVSFQQSASCEHFCKMLKLMPDNLPVYIVGPEAREAVELLETVVGVRETIFPVLMTSDNFFASSCKSS